MQEMTNRMTQSLHLLHLENHDNCTSCGYKFTKGDTTHLGYDKDDKAIYVCDSCSFKLKETAVRYYFSLRPYEVPEAASKLWRYMDFTKYVSLLSSRGLYFSRVDCFEDSFEGAKGYLRNKDVWDEYNLVWLRDVVANPPHGIEHDLSVEEIEIEAQRLYSQISDNSTLFRKKTYISCWHENEHESEAMWRLYSKVWDNAIAIRTTYQSLYVSLGRDPKIPIGRVRYIDMNKSYAGHNDVFWRKRKSFEHEREVRALTMDFESNAPGKIMPCDLDVLIEEVFVSPNAPTWFVSLVNDINKKYFLNVKVSSSELDETPFF